MREELRYPALAHRREPIVRNAIYAVTAALAFCTAPLPAAADAEPLERLRAEALSLINEARRSNGLDPLEQTAGLNNAAQSHASDMLERDYYGHVSPEGETVRDRYLEQGGSRWKLVSENIARCQGCPSPPGIESVRSFQEGWMTSPPHRRNILAEGLEGFGFGIAGGDGEVYAVQTFAGPGISREPAPDEEPVALSPEAGAAAALEAITRERRRAAVPPVKPSAELDRLALQLLPGDKAGDALISQPANLFDLLPADRATSWARLDVLAAACGGCGATPTAADVDYFIQQWLGDPERRTTLLDPAVSHLGFALRADGEGRKVAAMVAGQQR